MKNQLDLFAWGATRPTAEIIDAVPRLLDRIRREAATASPRPHVEAIVIAMRRGAA